MKKRRLLAMLGYGLFVFVALELGVRAYWAVVGGSFVDAPDRMYLRWQPELKGIEARRDDETFDVLLLGGSVLHYVAPLIEEALDGALDVPVVVHDASRQGHTSLDSRSKYSHLEDNRFDLVLFYHAINEARANNCPPDVFREDYAHYAWYRAMQVYDTSVDPVLTLPLTLRYVWAKLAPQIGVVESVPKNVPREEWLDYGADVRTGPPFRRNLNWIVDAAAHRGDPLVVLAFATFVPPGYSHDRFFANDLGLAEGGMPTRVWGRWENVVEAVAIHNESIVDLRDREDVQVVDMRTAVPAEPHLWRDICHMSDEGRGIWVRALIEELEALGRLP